MRRIGICRAVGRQPHGFVKGLNLDMRHIPSNQPMFAAQFKYRLDRGLRPAAHRVGFIILFFDQPAVAQITPVFWRLFQRQGRGTGKATLCKICRRGPGHRPPARAVFDHGRVINTAHHLTARPVIFGDAKGVTCLRGIKFQGARADPRRSDGHPCTGCVIIACCAMQGQSQPAGKFVTYSNCCDKLLAVVVSNIHGKSHGGGENATTCMPLGCDETIMAIKRVDGGSCGQGVPCWRSGAPVKQHRQVPAKEQRRAVTQDMRGAGGGATYGDAHKVQKVQQRLVANLFG